MTLAILETLRFSEEDHRSYAIAEPEAILECRRLDEVEPLLRELDLAVKRGYFAIGFMGYEAGYRFLPHLPPVRVIEFPLAWFALTRSPQTASIPLDGFFQVEDLQLSLSADEYRGSIESIRRLIEAGDTYQVNFTMQFHGKFAGSPRGLYHELRRKQRVPYAAYVETEEWAVLSLSPELFFRKRGFDIRMRPMKGTAPRGRTLEEDQIQIRALEESPKEQSENLMIVDLLRNDLGKICETGSVRVVGPMRVERYETLFQMTSTIDGTLKEGIGIRDIFHATFPSGSVTGAPKLRTMQIIHELENTARGVYTGAVGFVSSEESVFNVAIRTAVVDRAKGVIEMGVGSGILYEADPFREYQECELKGKFLTEPLREFQLLETILWEPEKGFLFLPRHLDRLMNSAEYFMVPIKRETVESELLRDENRLQATGVSHRVRLLADHAGVVIVQTKPLDPVRSHRIRFSSRRTNSSDRFLYHKTTNRTLYDDELQRARDEGCFDVLFLNEREELTEGAISNVFVEKNGLYYTPPTLCGVLPGIYRRHLLETRPFPVEERVLHEVDVLQADAVYLTNSLRGMIHVELLSRKDAKTAKA